MTLFGYFDNGIFTVFENCEISDDEREKNTKTPSKLLLDNHNKKSMVDDISECVKELSSEQLREIKDQILMMNSPLKEVV